MGVIKRLRARVHLQVPLVLQEDRLEILSITVYGDTHLIQRTRLSCLTCMSRSHCVQVSAVAHTCLPIVDIGLAISCMFRGWGR